eukprot:m.106341 g.106341  ORF g.106341 m.106341 type:complete len:323 (-) comp15149_c0_seq3:43-1011(-)
MSKEETNERLLKATERGHLDSTQLAISNGADINCHDKQHGWTPLHMAISSGNRDIVRLLIERRADLKATTIDGQTPLHTATIYGHIDIVRLLIERGANVKATTDYDSTPLHEASQRGHVDIARLLIERGADITAQDADGSTPFDYAYDDEMKQLLRVTPKGKSPAATPSVLPPTITASSNDSPDIFISLRFGEAHAAGEALKTRLVAKGLRVFLCAVQAGGDIMTEIVNNIDKCKMVVIMGTKTYGTQTEAAFSTHEELKFIVNEKKEKFLVKMCDRFDDPLARFHLGGHVSFHLWQPQSEAEQRQVPDALVNAIMQKLSSV